MTKRLSSSATSWRGGGLFPEKTLRQVEERLDPEGQGRHLALRYVEDHSYIAGLLRWDQVQLF